jgi:hypothetical protein
MPPVPVRPTTTSVLSGPRWPPRKAAGPPGQAEGERARCRPRSTSSSALSPAPRPWPRHGPQSLLSALDRSSKPPSCRLKGSSPFDGRYGPTSRPTPGPLDQRQALEQRQALRQRQELAPGKVGRYREGNCPGCGNAPIEAMSQGGWTAVRLGRYL